MHPVPQSPRRTLLISHTTAIKNNILEDERYTVKNVSICILTRLANFLRITLVTVKAVNTLDRIIRPPSSEFSVSSSQGTTHTLELPSKACKRKRVVNNV